MDAKTRVIAHALQVYVHTCSRNLRSGILNEAGEERMRRERKIAVEMLEEIGPLPPLPTKTPVIYTDRKGRTWEIDGNAPEGEEHIETHGGIPGSGKHVDAPASEMGKLLYLPGCKPTVH